MASSLYTNYNVGLCFRNGIAGTMPLDENIARRYIELYGAGVSNMLKLGRQQEGEVTEEAMQAYLRASTTVFRIDEQGPYLRDFQVTAMLRDAAKLLAERGAKTGMIGFTVSNGGVVLPERLHLGGEPKLVERPVTPYDRNGHRVPSLAVFQVMEDVSLLFPVKVIKNDAISLDLFKRMWQAGENIGLGGFRHLGYGKFDITVLRRGTAQVPEPQEVSA